MVTYRSINMVDWKIIQTDLLQQALLYARRLWPFFLVSVALFLFFILVGFIISGTNEEVQSNLMTELVDLVSILERLSTFDLMLVIWINNTLVLFLAMVGGFLLGLFPIVILVTNGLIIGLLLNSFWQAGQGGIFLISILPHGVVELSAIFIGSAVGLLAGWKVFRKLFAKESFGFKEAIGEMRLIFYGLSIALLLAAAIEVYITPWVLGLFWS